MTEIPTDKHRAAGRRPAGNNAGLLTRLRRDALQALAAGPLYRHTLIGRVPDDQRVTIKRAGGERLQRVAAQPRQ